MKEFYLYWFILCVDQQIESFILSSKDEYLSTNNSITSTLISCYPERRTTVLCNSESDIIEFLWAVPSISVILYNNSKTFNANCHEPTEMNFYLLSYRSRKQLNDTLWSLKNTPWWNIMATFFIFDHTSRACRDAEIILKMVWSINIPTAIFICKNSNKIVMMYAFNPYTKWAPKSWKYVKTDKRKDNRWSLYNHPFYNNDEICKDIRFDRSKYLDGYQVRATSAIFYSNSKLLKPGYDPSKLKAADFVRTDISHAFAKSLNINLSVFYFKYNYRNPECIYQGLGEGLYDLTFGVLPMHAIDNFPLLFPFIAYETTTIMQKRGYYTPLEKIQKYYGVITVVSGTIVLSIVFFVVLISQGKRNFHFAIFEVLRLLTNSALLSKINKLPLRIFFFVIFVFFLIIHATFSGNLSAFLTKPELRSTPVSTKSLEDSYIEVIYIPNNVSFDYSNHLIRDKIILMNNYDCASVILNNTAAVCLNNRPDLISLAAQQKHLRVSKKPLAYDYYSFITRKDWPLKQRADTVVLWFIESGHSMSFWKNKIIEEKEENMKRVDERSNVKYRPIILKDFQFAFVILVFGHFLGTISLLFEMIMKYLQMKNEKRFVKVTQIISCNHDPRTIVLCEPLDSDLIQTLWEVPSISVILFNNSRTYNSVIKYLHKINYFLLFFESQDKFDKILSSLKMTPWWNVMITFLIFDQSNKSCSNADNILEYVWSMNILNAVLICHDLNKKLMLFTFNPFTSWAPKPWKKVNISHQKNNRWTLYYRQYHNQSFICNNFDIDRTQYLADYEIKSTMGIFYVNSSLIKPNYEKSKLRSADFVNEDMTDALKRALKVNLSVTYFEYDFQDPDSIYKGLTEELYDMTFSEVPVQVQSNFTPLYPLTAYKTSIIMQKRGFYTPFEKIQKFYGIITIISLSGILIITLLVLFILSKEKGLAFAVFEVLRLLTNSSLSSNLKPVPIRIFFIVIFLYFLIMHATFSSGLKSFLTNQEYRKTPETLNDLKESYVKDIYVAKDVSFDNSSRKIRDKVILLDNFDCSIVVLNNSRAVCLNNRLDLVKLATQYTNLHVSKKDIASDFNSFTARNNWPLKDRVDFVMIWLSDFGYSSDFWMKKYIEDDEINMKRVEARSYVKNRPISLHDLDFTFIALAFGLTVGLISFVIEIFSRPLTVLINNKSNTKTIH